MSNNYDSMFDDTTFGSDSPLTGTQSIVNSAVKNISLTLDDISEFSLNPRRVENPLYDEIRESIRAIGLENPLVVTKRPGEPGYTLFNGGNTRLRALKSLWKETQDSKYFYQDCRFIPFSSDSEILIRHMIENEMRGEMTLLDKALAAFKIKQLAEHESGKTISSRSLSEMLGNQGWKISYVSVTLLLFTAENLSERIPKALAAGMGRAKIEEIRKIYHAIRKYVDDGLAALKLDSGDIQTFFLDALTEFDDPEESNIAQEGLRETCDYIEKLTNIDSPRVHFEIMHIFNHGELYHETNRSSDVNDLGQPIVRDYPDRDEGEHHVQEGGDHPPALSATGGAGGYGLDQDLNQDSAGELQGAEADEQDVTNNTAPIVIAHSEQSALVRATELLISQVTYLRMRYPLVSKHLVQMDDPPYLLPGEHSLREMLDELEQKSDRFVIRSHAETVSITDDDIVEAIIYDELSSLFFSWHLINLINSTEDTQRLFHDHCLQEAGKITDKCQYMKQIVHGYRCGFWIGSKSINEALDQFGRLHQYLRTVMGETFDKDSS